jgi:murein DD-endopeptidase MepM/ murein hydrolase activator NlpD
MKRIGKAVLAAAALMAIGARRPRPEPVLRLSLPIACHLGSDCAIQNYVDDDPGVASHDFLCRGRSYDSHNGTDFRIPSLARMQQGVAVLASAPGRVLRMRDGVPDISVRERGTAAVAAEQCGNGVVVDNGLGWETQYCHLAKGSVRVKPGQRVKAGAPLGLVGLSGDTEFPHLHLSVRKDGHAVDPFAYGAALGSCGGGRQLWRERIAYQSGQVLVAGFATRTITLAEAQSYGPVQQPRPSVAGPALVAFIQVIGLEKGDVQKLSIYGPDARVVAVSEAAPLDHDKAQVIVEVGRQRPVGGWTPGVYQANYAVRRGGVDTVLRTFQIVM